MILTDHLADVRDLLRAAAISGRTLSFRQLFDLFPDGVVGNDVFDTLDAASVELADLKDAIYSAVMAKAKTGVPGDGFFDTFRIHRYDDYLRIAGNVQVNELTDVQRAKMVAIERPLVYAHAKTRYVMAPT